MFYELMGLIVVVAAILFAGYYIFGRTQPRGVLTPSTGDPSYRNALEMARIIERLLTDDLVRCTIPEDLQGRMRRAVSEFFTPELEPPRD